MKKVILVIPFCILIVLGTLSLASAEYSVTQVTTNSTKDITPKISKNGDTVWIGRGLYSQEIFVQDGVTRVITQLTNNSVFEESPQINDNGDVVWEQWNEAEVDKNIMLYTKAAVGNKITRLDPPDDPWVMDSDSKPQINNNRQVAWRSFDGSYNQIMFYDGVAPAFQVTNNNLNNNALRLNNKGDMAWTAGSLFTGMTDIWLYDSANGARATTATAVVPEFSPQINDSGDVVWYGWSGATMSSGNFEIYYYTRASTATSRLTNNAYDDMHPLLNATGQIAWMADISTTDTEIYFRNGVNGTNTNITNSPEDDGDFSLNDSGWVVWAKAMGSIENDDSQIWVYDGTTTLRQLTSNVAHDNIGPELNNSNDLVWSGTGGSGTIITDYEIFAATTSILCTPPAAGACNDTNACTTDGYNAGAPGPGTCPCVYTPVANGTACNDVQFCTVSDTCSGGTCQTGAAMDCSDGRTCTDDICTAGVCSNPVNCVAPAMCNAAGNCAIPSCTAPANGCEDSNVCTDNDWDITVEGGICPCLNTNNSASCDDGLFCTVSDTCSGGTCGHSGTPCTVPPNTVCDETTDTCKAPSCSAPADGCEDNNVCTTDGYDPTVPGPGTCPCANTPVANGTVCIDGNLCTTIDICSGGTCQSGTAVVCNDNNSCTDDACDSGTGCIYTNNGSCVGDGDMSNDGEVDINDALKALRIAAGIDTATAGDLSSGDVAPMVNGVPSPDGKINIGDVVVILRRAVGLIPAW